MDKRIKARWVKALRSGKYQQGTNHLKSHDRFCCLGVLCDLVEDEVPKNRNYYGRGDFDKVQLPAGMDSKLALYNDGVNTKQRSFKWIASYIERYL